MDDCYYVIMSDSGLCLPCRRGAFAVINFNIRSDLTLLRNQFKKNVGIIISANKIIYWPVYSKPKNHTVLTYYT